MGWDQHGRVGRTDDRFRALFEDLGEPVVEVCFEDGDPIVERINEAFEAEFGLTDDVVGRNLDDLIVPEGDESAPEINCRAMDGEAVEREVRRGTDELRTYLFRSAPFTGPDGRQRGHGIYVDVSDRKRRERELRRKKERLEEFAGVVSHDLRGPLSVARGRLEMATADAECDCEYPESIDDALRRMETLVDDLLTLARSGRTVDAFEPVDLGAVARQCWANVETADADLTVSVDRDVMADPGRLREVFENLFRNAVEHAGADVTVTVGDRHGGFYVEDDGPGIPPGERDQAFDPGYSTSDEGTGFGLRIVEEVLEAHGWEVALTEGSAGGLRVEVRDVEWA